MKKQSLPTIQQNLFDIEPIDKKVQDVPRKQEVDSHVFDIVDALQSPVVTFDCMWADTIPRRLMDIIPMARMKALMRRERTATYAEVTAYLITRSFDAPMTSEWVDIYTHVSCQTLQEWFGEDRWVEMNAPRDLSVWLQSQLSRLRSDIWESRRKSLKEPMKSEEANAADRVEETDLGLPAPQQTSLF